MHARIVFVIVGRSFGSFLLLVCERFVIRRRRGQRHLEAGGVQRFDAVDVHRRHGRERRPEGDVTWRVEVASAAVSPRRAIDALAEEDDDADGGEHGQGSAEKDDGAANRVRVRLDRHDIVGRVDDDLGIGCRRRHPWGQRGRRPCLVEP